MSWPDAITNVGWAFSLAACAWALAWWAKP